MKFLLWVSLALFATVAMAQDKTDLQRLNEAVSAAKEKEAAVAIGDIDQADVASIRVSVRKILPPGPSKADGAPTFEIILTPGPAMDAVLAAIKGDAAAKEAEAQDKLDALGVTVEPAVPVSPVE